jgi:hypothetical protein
MHRVLPTHPTLVHPVTGKPLRAIFVSKSGRVFWPVIGASEPPAPPAPLAPPAPPAPTPPAPPGPPAPPEGFPPNTPLEQMSVEQREAYWKHHSRKHEDRAKQFGDLTPEQLAELREKAARADALDEELASDKDKAVSEAKKAAKAESDATYQARLVRTEFKAALKGRVPDEELDTRLTSITEPLDLSKFLTDTGDVDTVKVSTFVDSIAPAKGTPPPKKGPTVTGHGPGTGGDSTLSGLSGSELYDRLHKKPQPTS